MAEKIGFVSLGCPKNLVDSEQMLYLLDEAGYELTVDIDQADAVVVNTCGFIDEAKSEAIENILELCTIKNDKGSRLRAVIAAGCLSERYREELYTEIPELDGVVGCSAHGEIVRVLQEALAGNKPLAMGEKNAPMQELGRIPAMPPYVAYVKIAEGCNNRCAYCTIPSIRGDLRSRKMEDVLAECRALAQGGAVELIVVAQDITKYGMDLYGVSKLPELLEEICAIDTVRWVRLHYANPDGITQELIDVIARNPKILRYLDIPIQHIAPEMLQAMNRHYTADHVRQLLPRLREALPGLVLRTSLVIGFPGETEEMFDALCTFLREAHIERAGAFAFSPQEGTVAAELPDQIPDDVKKARLEQINTLQAEIMDAFEESRVGKNIDVICEGYDALAEVYYGRSGAESPDVDGKIFFKAKKGSLSEGQIVSVKINEVFDGEPLGRVATSRKKKEGSTK